MAKKQKSDDYRRLQTELRGGELKPLYLIYGSEAYLEEAAVKQLKSLCMPESNPLDEEIIDLDERPDEELLIRLSQSLKMPAFMAKRRFILIRNSGLFYKHKSLEEAARRLIEASNEGACLCFYENRVDRRTALYKELERREATYSIEAPDSAAIGEWVASYFRKFGRGIDAAAVESLIERCDASMCLMRSEMEKLRIYVEGSGADRVSLATVEAISIPNLNADIFALCDAISRKQLPESLELYQRMMARREPHAVILLMLQRHFRELYVLRSARAEHYSEDYILEVLAYKKSMRWKIDKLARQARLFDALQLSFLIKLAAKTDLRMKQTSVDADALLMELLATANSHAAF
ncbi:MAG: DNA polymerase III subunit delta [Eubacteriales bacterium]|nr:DNA polymerase III subunit delta [Eubacteriales bacterium]